MPRINRYSAVTQKMADRLAAAGYSKSPSTLESWARSGLAPRPVRFSRGRKGSTSAYPPGAFEQYLAVARVMQPGRDVREAALMLISDGDLPTSEGLFRRAVDYLFEGSEVEGDPLELADQAYSAALADRQFAPMSRFLVANAKAAALTDQLTCQSLAPEAVVEGAMVNSLAAMHGRPIPSDGALSEMGAAIGFFEPGLPDEEVESRSRFLDALYDEVYNFEFLRKTASNVTPERLQAAVREYRSDAPDLPLGLLDALPPAMQSLMGAIIGVALIRMENLGGQQWFDRVVAPVEPSIGSSLG